MSNFIRGLCVLRAFYGCLSTSSGLARPRFCRSDLAQMFSFLSLKQKPEGRSAVGAQRRGNERVNDFCTSTSQMLLLLQIIYSIDMVPPSYNQAVQMVKCYILLLCCTTVNAQTTALK